MSAETLISDIRSTLVEVIADIDAYTSAPPPAPAPEPSPPPPAPVTKHFTENVNLFGPVQANGAMSQVPGTDFGFQGSALTASTKYFRFDFDHLEVATARAVIVWAPGSASNELELIKFTDGPANVERIGHLLGANLSTPTAQAIDLTAAWQAMVNAKQARHVGFRMKGPTTYTLYEVRLEITYKIS